MNAANIINDFQIPGAIFEHSVWKQFRFDFDVLYRKLQMTNLIVDDAQRSTWSIWAFVALTGNTAAVISLINETPLAIKEPENSAILRFAAWSGSQELVRYLVETCALNPKDENQKNLMILHFAAWSGNQELVDHLITKYALDPKDTDECKRSILHFAAWSGNQTLVDHLITQHRLNPNNKDECKRTALHYAVWSGNHKTVLHLIERYDLNPDETDINRQTALDYLKATNNAEYLRIRKIIDQTRIFQHFCDACNRRHNINDRGTELTSFSCVQHK